MSIDSLSALPYDVLEHIIGHIDSRKDVLVFALLSSLFRDIAIPRHIEYREIQFSVEDLYIWKHLAQRPDLASNIRTVIIRRCQTDSWRTPKSLLPSRSPAQRKYQQSEVETLLSVMKTMTRLKSLELHTGLLWFGPHPVAVVSRILRSCVYLEHFMISGLLESWREPDTEANSIWTMPELMPIMLPNTVYLPSPPVYECLISFSRNLQVLILPNRIGWSETLAISFAECRFLNLKELNIARWKPSLGHHLLHFLQAHPDIDRLAWYGAYPFPPSVSLPRGILPALKHLTADTWAVVEAFLPGANNDTLSLDGLECISPLFCPIPSVEFDYVPHVAHGRGRTLRRLSTPSPDIVTLRGLADVFPSVTHLHVRDSGLSLRRKSGYLFRKHVLIPLGMSKRRLDITQPTIEDAVALFPELEVLGGIEFKNSAHMRRVLTRHPKLRGFENPRFR
ncbi:hypothetical protein BV25DRAFT_1914482 [Artomyces pyxidatus]|uniref:Uncharacterized protein n=1 Tax=Artomyces pyxidatus TaxID=48021 RepID=A0ACB8T671_9AGAM|nr:hypothetical protein BV25DRAFT_1914482 [Artomyces pyxidatus]